MAHPADPSPPRPLEYEKRRAVLPWKWIWRGVALLVIGAVVGLSGPYVLDWASLAWLRHRVLTYVAPPDAPVMRQKPSDTETTWGGTTGSRYTRHNNATWTQAKRRLIPPLRASPGSSVTLFLHELVSPSGNRRVVAINMAPSWFPEGTLLRADIRLFEPGSLLKPRFRELQVRPTQELIPGTGQIPGFPGLLCDLGTVPWGTDFRLFPGRVDPADPSRFLIDYIHDGTTGTFVGQLNDDDSFTLRLADGSPLPMDLGETP